jgi:hypothetical protein
LTNHCIQGIITVGGDGMREDEYSHKGIDRAAQIDRKIIESNEYRREFDNATDNPKLNKTLYESAKSILADRSGTHYESMRWIDGDSGNIITAFNDMGRIPKLIGEDHEFKVEYGENILHKLNGYNNIVVIHNHPSSTAPSAGDFNSAYTNGYEVGFVVTHDGRVFKYTSHESISEMLYIRYWQRHMDENNDKIDAQKKAIGDLLRNFKITCEEVYAL